MHAFIDIVLSARQKEKVLLCETDKQEVRHGKGRKDGNYARVQEERDHKAARNARKRNLRFCRLTIADRLSLAHPIRV